jgi:hypothetical protein
VLERSDPRQKDQAAGSEMAVLSAFGILGVIDVIKSWKRVQARLKQGSLAPTAFHSLIECGDVSMGPEACFVIE